MMSLSDTQGGGAGATALAAAARLGAKARMLARLGDDETGTRILKGLSDFRVDVSLVSRVPGGRSSSSYVMVNPQNGSRTKFPYRDNLPPLSFDSPEQAAIAEADALHLDGTNYINAVHAARIARQSGTLVSLDGCSRQADNDLNRQLAAMADLLVMNAVYPFRVSERQDREDALRYMAGLGRAKAVLMTAGADGVRLCAGRRTRPPLSGFPGQGGGYDRGGGRVSRRVPDPLAGNGGPGGKYPLCPGRLGAQMPENGRPRRYSRPETAGSVSGSPGLNGAQAGSRADCRYAA